jgi:hypothetical protein
MHEPNKAIASLVSLRASLLDDQEMFERRVIEAEAAHDHAKMRAAENKDAIHQVVTALQQLRAFQGS